MSATWNFGAWIQWIYCWLRFVLNSWSIRLNRLSSFSIRATTVMPTDLVIRLYLTVIQWWLASRRFYTHFWGLDHSLTERSLLDRLNLKLLIICVLIQYNCGFRDIRSIFETQIIVLFSLRLLIWNLMRRVLRITQWWKCSNLIQANLRAAKRRTFILFRWDVLF